MNYGTIGAGIVLMVVGTLFSWFFNFLVLFVPIGLVVMVYGFFEKPNNEKARDENLDPDKEVDLDEAD